MDNKRWQKYNCWQIVIIFQMLIFFLLLISDDMLIIWIVCSCYSLFDYNLFQFGSVETIKYIAII